MRFMFLHMYGKSRPRGWRTHRCAAHTSTCGPLVAFSLAASRRRDYEPIRRPFQPPTPTVTRFWIFFEETG